MRQIPWKKPKSKKKVLFWTLGSFLVFVLIAGAIVWAALSKLGDFETIDNAFPDESTRPEANVAAEGQDDPATNILLLGSDSRADTIMVAHIPSDRSGVQIMSIMRDSWVEIPGYGQSKINAAMSHRGVPLMIETIEDIIDQRIDYVAVADFNGFKNITNALRGVQVNNPRAFSYGDHQIQQGPITLNGDQAPHVRAQPELLRW